MIVSCPSCQTGFHLRAEEASPASLARCGRCRAEVPLARPRRSYRILTAAAAPRAHVMTPALATAGVAAAAQAAAAAPRPLAAPAPALRPVRRLEPISDLAVERPASPSPSPSNSTSDARTRWALSMLVGAAVGSLAGPPLGASALLSIATGTALGAMFAARTALWSSSRT